MLTVAQCRTVAFWTDEGLMCHKCAYQTYGELNVSRSEVGFDNIVRPVSQYEVDELQAQRGYELDDEDKPPRVYWSWIGDGQGDYYFAPAVECDSCGEEIEPAYSG